MEDQQNPDNTNAENKSLDANQSELTAPTETATPVAETPAVATEAQAQPAVAAKSESKSMNPKQIVLQWLSYTLWSWSLITIATLLSSSLTYFLVSGSKDDGSYEWQLYFVAAMICLVPAAFFVDRVFAKHEQPKKHGFAAVVMVLNAVGVFLAALGSTIAFVIGLFRLILSTGDTTGTQVLIISSLVVSILTFALFFRILNLEKFKAFTTIYRYTMLGVSVLALILTFVGPFVRELSLKQDRLIESGLEGVSSAIKSYANKNDKLPETLDDLDFSTYQSSARDLARSGAVEYKPEGSTVDVDTLSNPKSSFARTTTVYRYQLCVTYKAAKQAAYDTYESADSDGYLTYVSTYSHPKGRECYKLKTSY